MPFPLRRPRGSGGGGDRRGSLATPRWARKQSVKNSKTLFPSRRHVSATLSTRSTNRLPDPLASPLLDLRQGTACRSARSPALFVGSILGTRRKLHRCSSRSNKLRHLAAVFSLGHEAPRPAPAGRPTGPSRPSLGTCPRPSDRRGIYATSGTARLTTRADPRRSLIPRPGD
jgi:hypothetical protein